MARCGAPPTDRGVGAAPAPHRSPWCAGGCTLWGREQRWAPLRTRTGSLQKLVAVRAFPQHRSIRARRQPRGGHPSGGSASRGGAYLFYESRPPPSRQLLRWRYLKNVGTSRRPHIFPSGDVPTLPRRPHIFRNPYDVPTFRVERSTSPHFLTSPHFGSNGRRPHIF